MKICITADGESLESNVDPRFGRCKCFIFYDTKTDKFEAVSNTNSTGMGGVGIQSASMMAERGIEIVLTGNLGPNASSVIQQAGIKTITGVNGKIKDAVEGLKKGILQASNSPNATVLPHFGIDKREK
jgi:predicted Fe-Mo cluster-binding NifX family protein